jgi:hypothetical protein
MKIPSDSKTNTNPMARKMELTAPKVISTGSFLSLTLAVLV